MEPCAPQASKVTITDEDGDVSVYGGWGFTIVGILCIAYAVAVLHTVVFGLMTWMKRLEAPAPTHGLGPRAAAVRSSLPPSPLSISFRRPCRQLLFFISLWSVRISLGLREGGALETASGADGRLAASRRTCRTPHAPLALP